VSIGRLSPPGTRPVESTISPVWPDLIYLAISIGITLWVGRFFHRNGRIFLVEIFQGRESFADSLNHLLVVGFYLVNIGWLTLALRLEFGSNPANMSGAVEFLSTKVGLVLLVLGGMHLVNLLLFSIVRRKIFMDSIGPVVEPRNTSASIGEAGADVAGRDEGEAHPLRTLADELEEDESE